MKTLRSQAGCFSVRGNGLRPCLVSLIPLRVEIDTHQVPHNMALCQFKHYIVKKENNTNFKIATEKNNQKYNLLKKKMEERFLFCLLFRGNSSVIACFNQILTKVKQYNLMNYSSQFF